jgi:glycosyltransferase involved in cell wall biosynthesis
LARFAFFSTCPEPWGGSEELWAGTAAALAESGHSVAVFKTCVDRCHPRILRLLALGCRIRDLHQACLPSRVQLPKSLVQLTRRTISQRAVVPFLRRHLAKLKTDLVVVSQGGNFDGLVYSDLCRTSGRPYVIVSQKATDHIWPSDPERAVMRSVFQAAQKCFFVSQHNLRLTERQIGETLTNAATVRNPFLVSSETSSPWPSRQDDTMRLACVARLCIADKGQDILLQVLAREKWRNRKLSVSFFGAGRNREGLRELAARLGLKNISFPGFVNDIESVWRSHHALVLASRTEGLPLSLIEAMMSGRFGIVTNEGGNSEVIEDGRTGFLAGAPKVDEFDDAMERAWAARDDWESIGKAAGAAVRTIVPPDPVARFACKLLELVDPLNPQRAALPVPALQNALP